MYLFTQINQSVCPRQINRVRFELVQFGVKMGNVFSNSFAGKKRRCIFFILNTVLFGLLSVFEQLPSYKAKCGGMLGYYLCGN